MKTVALIVEDDGKEKEYRVGNSYFAIVVRKGESMFGNERWTTIVDGFLNGYLNGKDTISEEIYVGKQILVEITNIETPAAYFNVKEIRLTVDNLIS